APTCVPKNSSKLLGRSASHRLQQTETKSDPYPARPEQGTLMPRRTFLRRALLPVAFLVACLVPHASLHSQQPAEATWTANGGLENADTRRLPGVGAAQGVSFRDGTVYLFGRVWDARPRVGDLREYTTYFAPTGRVVWLRRGGNPLLVHPTGLT